MEKVQWNSVNKKQNGQSNNDDTLPLGQCGYWKSQLVHKCCPQHLCIATTKMEDNVERWKRQAQKSEYGK